MCCWIDLKWPSRAARFCTGIEEQGRSGGPILKDAWFSGQLNLDICSTLKVTDQTGRRCVESSSSGQ